MIEAVIYAVGRRMIAIIAGAFLLGASVVGILWLALWFGHWVWR